MTGGPRFAVVAVEHAQVNQSLVALRWLLSRQVYWNLLESVEPSTLRLTKSAFLLCSTNSTDSFNSRHDEEIFNQMKETFPTMFEEPYTGLVKLDEDYMKSKEGKEKWRKLIASYALVCYETTKLPNRIATRTRLKTTTLVRSFAPMPKMNMDRITRSLVPLFLGLNKSN